MRNGRGETLIETLVSLAVAAISLLMFASMIFHTASLAKTGRDRNSGFAELNALLERRTVSGGSVTSGDGSVAIAKEDGTLTFIDEPVEFYSTNYGGEYVISYETTAS